MPKTYVCLDLETTGLDPQRDAIIEIGAVRCQGSEELASFSTFINPGRRIPSFITDLTGITDDHVMGAPSIRQVGPELSEFVGRDLVIGHNVGFDLSFLRPHGTLTRNPSIDTFEIASILVPHAQRYSLANLIKELGINLPPQTHRALDDARMTHALYACLFERAVRLPRSILEEIVRLGHHVRWTPRYFFQDALHSRAREGFQMGIGTQLAAQRGGDAAGPLFLPEVEFDPLEPRRTPIPLDVAALMDLLGEDGRIAQLMTSYESRFEQQEMLEAVAQTFNSGGSLLVEAGTGTGKSLAYLLPAVRWADQNDDRVVISTNTINLQEQLLEKDIPVLSQVFPTSFRAMVLKGRSHYLCRRQFQALRRNGPTSRDEMRVLAKILLWLPNTLDGDGDEIFLPTPRERAIWGRLCAAAENCSVRDCPHYHNEGCFFYRARERAETAHVLVVNHALLLADVATENRVLPAYEHLIIDEAHHLEHATTEALHFHVNWYALRYTIEELTEGRGNAPGILHEIQNLAHLLPREMRGRLEDTIIRLEDAADEALQRLEVLFDTLENFMEQHVKQYNPHYSVRLRITPDLRGDLGWDAAELAWDATSTPFGQLVERTSRLSSGLEDLSVVEAPALENPRARLVAVARRLSETQSQLRALITEPAENAIYWLEKGRDNGPLSFHMVPLRVGPLVREHLFEKKKTTILTSATLRIGGTFDYLRERLEAWDALALDVGSPFDYGEAALTYVVNDIPEPGQAGYQNAVEETLLNLFLATEGRAMALFTSYSQLRATAKAITNPLGRADIHVFAQGGGGSRAQLLENFREDERSVLLGTRSFWEGVDIPGEALSCLVIAKLPFDVPSDPIVAARAEITEDPFNDYMVPEAVLRFLQGFGRLIRTRTDRGIAVILDKRLLTKRYGPRFLTSLPDPAVRMGSAAELPDIAAAWLAGAPLPPEHDPFDDGPWSDQPWEIPPPEEPPWW
ncbi:MAG: helicase C-terminal domain-containing protein [Anaerolineae bacterium]